MNLLKSIWRVKFNIAILISLLIGLIFGFYSILAIKSFYNYRDTINPKLELNLDIFHFFLRNELKKEWIEYISPKVKIDRESKLKSFHITLKKSDIDTLNQNLPLSGKNHYINGYMRVSDKKDIVYKIKLRYRGDHINHWLFAKKSLRVKLRKNYIYNISKKFNLISPPMISTFIDVINYNKAKEIGLISPDFYPIRLFINGKYMGLYFYLSQVDESLIRRYKKMPGSIYRDDLSSLSITDKSRVGTLFRDEKKWKKVSARNREQKSNREDIQYYIKSINSKGDIKFFNFFNNYLDKDKYYKFFALDVIFGSNHHDSIHNHYLYFDPYIGKFEPIEWDLRFWTAIKNKDASNYPLLNRVKLNPILEANRDKITYNLLISDKFSTKNINKILDNLDNQIFDDLNSDILRGSIIGNRYRGLNINKFFMTPFMMEEYKDRVNNLKEVYQKRVDNLKNIFENTVLKYRVIHINNRTIFKFSVDGNSPIEFNINKTLYRDIDFNNIIDSNDSKIDKQDIIYAGRKWIKGTINNWPKFQYGDRHLINSNLNYQYISRDKNISINDFNFTNYITGKKVIAKEGNIKSDKDTDSIHPWKLPKPKYQIKILKGNIEVNQTLIFDKYTTVKIEANTTLIMDSNCSIYFYGKVEAVGTKEKPIKFIAKNNDIPWGAIVVQGENTSKSKFNYCYFKNGSIDTKNLIHYTSQFNIHNSKDFEIKNSFIGKNYIGDDSLHIAYSKGIIDSCIFDGARSDGLDIDISDVVISNNIFKNSGNDGLDIMTTKMVAFNNSFENMGDKGISVGEWSEANITNSIFTNALIGLEIKDKSKVIANNLTFINSKEKAINLYNKNKRYDKGGFLKANNIKFIGNSVIMADKRSKYEIK